MIRRIESLLNILSMTALYAATGALLSLTSLVILASAMRYVVGRPLAFTEELVGLLFMAMVFLAIPMVSLRNQQISISVLSEKLEGRARSLLQIVAELIMLIFSAWFLIEAIKFAAYSKEITARSEHSELLMWPWMSIMCLAVALLIPIGLLLIVQSFLKFLKPDLIESEVAPSPLREL